MIRLISIISFSALVAVGGWLALGLEADNSMESFFIKSSPQFSRYMKFKKDFGAGEMLIVGICPKAPDGIARPLADDFIGDLEKIPHVAAVYSPKDFMGGIGGSAMLMDRAVKAGFVNLEKNIVGVIVFFKPDIKLHGKQIHEKVQAIQQKWEHRFKCLHIAGHTILNSALDDSAGEVIRKFFPILLLLSVLLLTVLYRNPLFVIAPLLATGCAEILTLGAIAISGVSFNLVLTLIPTMVFVFALSSSIHILNHFQTVAYATAETGSKIPPTRLIEITLGEKAPAVFYSLLTTALGFLSLGFSHIEPIRNLGLFSAVGCLMTGLSVFIILPAALRLRGLHHNVRIPPFLKAAENLLVWLFKRLVNLRYLLVAFCIAISAFSIYSFKLLPIETNALNYFSDGAAIKSDIIWIEKNLTGMSSVNVLIDRNVSLARRERFISILGESKQARAVITRELFAQNPPLKFYSGGQERIVIQSATGNLESLEQLKEDINAGAKKAEIGAVVITGQYPLILESQGEMIKILVNSLGIAMIVICLVILVIARSASLAMAVAIPNLTTVFSVFLFMRLLSIPIDITTVTVAAVALGIAVDDTIHLMIHYRHKRMAGAPFEEAVAEALRTAGLPVVVTSLITGFGFATLILSGFIPIQNFGILMSLTIFTALILDLTVTPAVLKFANNIAPRITLNS